MGQIARLTLGPLLDHNDGAHDRLATHSPAREGFRYAVQTKRLATTQHRHRVPA